MNFLDILVYIGSALCLFMLIYKSFEIKFNVLYLFKLKMLLYKVKSFSFNKLLKLYHNNNKFLNGHNKYMTQNREHSTLPIALNMGGDLSIIKLINETRKSQKNAKKLMKSK